MVPAMCRKMLGPTHQRLKVDAVQGSPVYVSPNAEEVGDIWPVTMLRTRCRGSRQSRWLALGAIKVVTFAHQTELKSDRHVGLTFRAFRIREPPLSQLCLHLRYDGVRLVQQESCLRRCRETSTARVLTADSVPWLVREAAPLPSSTRDEQGARSMTIVGALWSMSNKQVAFPSVARHVCFKSHSRKCDLQFRQARLQSCCARTWFGSTIRPGPMATRTAYDPIQTHPHAAIDNTVV